MLWKPLWYRQGIKCINDLLDNKGDFLTCKEFAKKYNLKDSFLEYMSFISAIPKEWEKELNNTNNKNSEDISEQYCTLFVKKPKAIYMYQALKSLHVVQPTCIRTWAEQYGLVFDEKEWKFFFMLPWNLTRDHKLIEFQFKILHKVFASKSYVNRFDKSVSDMCAKCNVKANTIHMLYECQYVKVFWCNFVQIAKGLSCIKPIQNVSLENVLFGINDKDSEALNYCIMHAKWFLFLQYKSLGYNESIEKMCTMNKFFIYLRYVVKIDENCNMLKDKYETVKEFVKIID